MILRLTIRRLLLVIGALLFATSLQGCFFGPSNSIRLSALPKPGSAETVTRLVYGLDASNGGLSVALARYDPATGDAGNCGRFDHTEATSADSGITYFVFDVPPGSYIMSFYYSSGYLADEAPSAFVVRKGEVAYVGDFSKSTEPAGVATLHPLRLDRSGIDAAKATLGPGSEAIILAAMQPMTGRANAFICGF